MTASSLRILMAHNRYLVPGGEDISTRCETDLLQAAGHHVDLWEMSNETISHIGLLRTGLRAVWSRQACADLRRKLERNHYDILHVQNHFPLLSPALHHVAARFNVATIQHLRNFRLMCVNAAFFRNGSDCRQCCDSFMPWRGVLHRCYRASAIASVAPMAMVGLHKVAGTWSRHVDSFIAISSYVAEMHRQAGYPADRIFVRNCLMWPERKTLPRTTRIPAIVAPARLAPEKGLHILIEAWRRQPRAAVLHIAGSGPEERKLRALAQGDSTIRFEGQLAFEDLIELMATARAVVAPSLWAEPFGRVPMEAFSVGTPAIVSKIGGLLDIVEHGRNGILVEPGDVTGLADAIDTLLTQDDTFAAMSEAAHRTFAQKFSPAAMLRETEKIYEAAIQNRKMRAGRHSKPPVRPISSDGCAPI